MDRLAVAVIGMGAIGGCAAGCLLAAGRHTVVGCARKPLERLVFDGIEGVVTLPLATWTEPSEGHPMDWVLLCTKAHETESAGPWLRRLCGPSTRLAVLQNGIDHAERVAPFVGGSRVVPAVVYYNGERIAVDHVRFRRVADYELAVADDADGRDFAALFASTQFRVVLCPDMLTLQWRKLLVNAVANPITALTLQRQGVLRRPDIRALCQQVMEEAATVAVAAGARLAPGEPKTILEKLLTVPPQLGTSMYFDRQAGRPLEVEALNGAIVAAGKRLGVPTPLNGALLALLRAVSDAADADIVVPRSGVA
jgi:2-dehydropantoate 2-reductase